MINLFEQDIQTNARQSSKGNQLKWKNGPIWYKADYMGYEGLAEYVISHLLLYSALKEDEFVLYDPVQIRYKKQTFTGVSSPDFLKEDWQIITLERLFQNYYGESLNKAIWTISDHKNRLEFFVNAVQRITGLNKFGQYMNKLLTIDALFLNEDRHTHNIAVLMNKNGDFHYCPIFDNGAGLLSDLILDYPMSEEVYDMMENVQGRTFSNDFEEQLSLSESLYGMNLTFQFKKKDVDNILALDGSENTVSIYPVEMRERVRTIIYEQMRKYAYLFLN